MHLNLTRKAKKKILVINDKEMGSRVKEARKSLGINQTELARRMKVSQAEISNVERGDRKPLKIFEYAQALGVPADHLVTGK